MKFFLKDRTVTVKRYTRPSRMASIISMPDARREFARVIEWYTSCLGGPHNSIFLQDSLRKKSFIDLLFAHDPDFVMWIGKEDKSIRRTVDRLNPFANWKCKTLDNKNLAGYALSKFVEHHKAKHNATLSTTPIGHQLFFPSAAIMGILSQDDRHALSEHFDFEDVDYQKQDETDLLTKQPFSGLLRLNIEFLGCSEEYFERGYAIDKMADRSPFEVCMVVDKPDNIEAISLFWNLRAVYYTQPEIFFVPTHFFQSHMKETERFLWSTLGGIDKKRFRILSCSLSPVVIVRMLRRLLSADSRLHRLSRDQYSVDKNGKTIVFDFETVHVGDLFRYAHRRYGEYDSVAVSFDEYGGYLPYPDSVLAASKEWTYYVTDFDVPFLKLPRSNWLKFSIGFGDAQRLSSAGVSVLRGGYTSTEEKQLYLRLVDNLEGIDAIARDHGLKITSSDKGKMAMQVLGLTEGIGDLRIFSGSNVITFLTNCNPLQNSKGSMKRRLYAESAISFDTMSRELQSQYTNHAFVESVLNWMLNRHILRPGTVIRCESCYNQQFIPIDAIRQRMECQGCTSTMQIPLDDYRHLKLSYALNTLVAKAITQGFLSHLLALHFMAVSNDDWRSYSNLSFFYPGVEITRGDRLLGELDLVMVFDNEVIVGECKLGHELTRRDITHTINLGKKIGADIFAFCTIDKFSKLSIREIRKLGAEKHVRTIVIEKEHLVNQSRRKWVPRIGGRGAPPDLKLFCDDVIQSLRR